ncbi:MAG: hypothetical protein LBU37_06100 [Tannerellaceae bacterium]|jgi:uncharacterized membrane protein|nr:hypothetical protein [Tannerellaceae bacterium]
MKKKIYYAISACSLILIILLRFVLNYDAVQVSLALFPTMVLFTQVRYSLRKKIIFALIYSLMITLIWSDFSLHQIFTAVAGMFLAVASGFLIDFFYERKKVED